MPRPSGLPLLVVSIIEFDILKILFKKLLNPDDLRNLHIFYENYIRSQLFCLPFISLHPIHYRFNLC